MLSNLSIEDHKVTRGNLKTWLCISNSRHAFLFPGPVFCLLLGVSSDYAQPITGQVTEVTCPVIGRAQPELTPRKRQKMGPGFESVTHGTYFGFQKLVEDENDHTG